MNLKELQKKVAEVLGVSNSQSELAFETFTEKISESLYEGITLKVPRIGFFQLKSRDKKNGPNRPIIFTPLSVDFNHDSHNLYLTFEVQPKSKNTRELDSNVFSIGVGKPLLPLTIDDLPNSETSFAVLKKSIEERAKELITESDQIPNFNIFEDYYKISEGALHEEGTRSTLSDLTADIEFSAAPAEQTNVEPGDGSNILSTMMEELAGTKDQKETDRDESHEEISESVPIESENEEKIISEATDKNPHDELFDVEGKSSETVLAELLADSSEDLRKFEETPLPEINIEHSEEILDTIDVSSFLNKEEIPKEQKIDEEKIKYDSETLQVPNQSQEPEQNVGPTSEIENEDLKREESSVPQEEAFIKEHYIDEQKEEIGSEEKVIDAELRAGEGTEEETDLQKEFLDAEVPAEEKIEWNWGDELREEFGLGHLESEEAKYEMVDDRKFENEPELGKDSIRDLFAQLEKTLEHDRAFLDEDFHEEKRRTIETEIPRRKPAFQDDEKVYLELSSTPSKYEFVPAKTFEKESRMAISLADEPRDYFERGTRLTDDVNERPARKTQRESASFKLFLLYFSIFAAVAVAVFLVIRNSSGPSESTIKPAPQQSVPQSKIDSIKASIENASDSSKLLSDESSDFPISATPPVPIKTSSSTEKLPQEINALTSKNMTAASKKTDSNVATDTKNDLYKTSKDETRISNSIYYSGKNYYFQISSWRNKATAEQEVQRLRSLGFHAYLFEAYLLQKGGTWYRVRIGPFNSENEAQKFMSENNFK